CLTSILKSYMLVVFVYFILFFLCFYFFFFSSRRRHTRCLSDWSSDVCSSDLGGRARDGADFPFRDRPRDRGLTRRRNETRGREARLAAGRGGTGVMAFSQRFIEVDGCRLNLRRGGSGEPLIYLHGASGVPAVLPFMEKLAQRFDVL